MQMSSVGSEGTDAAPIGRLALYVLVVLSLANFVSFVDRQILLLLVEPIKAEFNASDTWIGLLQGPSFALLYAVAGLYLGALVDRANRTRLLVFGVTCWSLSTMACGFAQSYWQLFGARALVGIGEAVLLPVGVSLLSDLFPLRARARALGFFSISGSFGASFAFVAGGAFIGWLGSPQGQAVHPSIDIWRVCFIAAGALGIPVLLFTLFVREPARAAPISPERTDTSTDWIKSRMGVHVGVNLGYSLIAVVSWAAASWLPTLLLRQHGYSPREVGAMFGMTTLLFAPFGGLIAGAAIDALRRRGRRDGVLLVATCGFVGLVTSILSACLGTSQPAITASIAGYAFFSTFTLSTIYAALAEITPSSHRGRAVAIFGLTSNIIGYGIGPTAVGMATDLLFRDPAAVGKSIMLTVAVSGTLAMATLLWLRPRFAAAATESA
jgi:MFS family permease